MAAPPDLRTDAARRGGDVTLGHLPSEVADRLRFPERSPWPVRRAAVPPELAELARQVWDLAAAPMFDELRQIPVGSWASPRTAERLLARVRGLLRAAQPALFELAVARPLAADDRSLLPEAVAVGSGAGAAGAQEISMLTLGASGMGAVGFVLGLLTQLVAEMVETWVAASLRVHQYRAAGRSPDASMIAADLGDVGGFPGGRAYGSGALAVFLADLLASRTGRRFLRGAIPVAGAILGGAVSGRQLRRVRRQPLRAGGPEELDRRRTGLDTDSALVEPAGSPPAQR